MEGEFSLSAEAVKTASRQKEKYQSGNIVLQHNHKIIKMAFSKS